MTSNDGYGGAGGGYSGGGGGYDAGGGGYGPGGPGGGYGTGGPGGGYGPGAPGGGPGGYGPPPGGYPPPNRSNGLAIASLVFGILSLLGVCFVGIGGLLGLVAIPLGVMARRKVKLGQAGQGGLALGGIITGAIGVVVGIAVMIAFFALGMWGQQYSSEFVACSTLPADQQEECLQGIFTS